IQRAGYEDGIFRGGFGQGGLQRCFGFWNHTEPRGGVTRDLCKLRRRNRPWVAWLREDDFTGEREESASNLVNCFVAHGREEHANRASGEIFSQEICEFLGGGGVVSAIEIDIRIRLQL